MLNVPLKVISILCLIPSFISATAVLLCVILTKTLLIMDALIRADIHLSGSYSANGDTARHLENIYPTLKSHTWSRLLNMRFLKICKVSLRLICGCRMSLISVNVLSLWLRSGVRDIWKILIMLDIPIKIPFYCTTRFHWANLKQDS